MATFAIKLTAIVSMVLLVSFKIIVTVQAEIALITQPLLF